MSLPGLVSANVRQVTGAAEENLLVDVLGRATDARPHGYLHRPRLLRAIVDDRGPAAMVRGSTTLGRR